MSFWKVGKEAVPPYANMTVPKAKNSDLKLTSLWPGNESFCAFCWSVVNVSVKINTTAKVVVARAPAAAGQNSLGVPKKVNGQRMQDKMMIHMQKQIPVASDAVKQKYVWWN